jgi:hypothetical protein
LIEVWAEAGPGDVQVRGYSYTGGQRGEREVFRVPVVATAAGASEVSVDRAGLKLAPQLINIPERLVRFESLSLEVGARRNALDVTGDGQIAPIDALQIINHLNALGDRPAAATLLGGEVRLDANGDNAISPIDALMIINHLNSQRIGGEGESTSLSAPAENEASSASEADLFTLLAWDLDAETRRRR